MSWVQVPPLLCGDNDSMVRMSVNDDYQGSSPCYRLVKSHVGVSCLLFRLTRGQDTG